MERKPTDERLTVAEAADRLGISEDAIRSRIKRGTVASEREAGTVYVILSGDRPTTDKTTGQRPTTEGAGHEASLAKDELIAILREQLAAEREANRENRRLLLAALERPQREIEAETKEDPPEESGGPENQSSRPPKARAWWRFWES